mmetsp:Transcript_25434/g.70872  ORF Transcript_25434/g.70872 Transcript_25434/m.70872 type:complete len:492 (-) Transcript_25434:35-1510(-)
MRRSPAWRAATATWCVVAVARRAMTRWTAAWRTTVRRAMAWRAASWWAKAWRAAAWWAAPCGASVRKALLHCAVAGRAMVRRTLARRAAGRGAPPRPRRRTSLRRQPERRRLPRPGSLPQDGCDASVRCVVITRQGHRVVSRRRNRSVVLPHRWGCVPVLVAPRAAAPMRRNLVTSPPWRAVAGATAARATAAPTRTTPEPRRRTSAASARAGPAAQDRRPTLASATLAGLVPRALHDFLLHWLLGRPVRGPHYQADRGLRWQVAFGKEEKTLAQLLLGPDHGILRPRLAKVRGVKLLTPWALQPRATVGAVLEILSVRLHHIPVEDAARFLLHADASALRELHFHELCPVGEVQLEQVVALHRDVSVDRELALGSVPQQRVAAPLQHLFGENSPLLTSGALDACRDDSALTDRGVHHEDSVDGLHWGEAHQKLHNVAEAEPPPIQVAERVAADFDVDKLAVSEDDSRDREKRQAIDATRHPATPVLDSGC